MSLSYLVCRCEQPDVISGHSTHSSLDEAQTKAVHHVLEGERVVLFEIRDGVVHRALHRFPADSMCSTLEGSQRG